MPAPRFLIVRLSAIGDVIHTMPVACALRDALPEARITWIAEKRAATLLEGHEAIDELIMLPRGFLKSPTTMWQLRGRLRALHADVVVDVQGLSKSAVLGWLSGAKRRIGFARPTGREISPWLNNERIRPTAAHVVDQFLELLRPLGVERPAVRFSVPQTETERLAADRFLKTPDLDGGFALINAGAGWPSKQWPPDRFAAVARHLGERWRLPSLVVWAGEQERCWAQRIVEDARGRARLAPPTSLRELAAVARRACLFVGSDTGPLHLAAAVGTPCVGLFGPWPAERNGPYGPQHVAVQKMRLDGTSRQRRRAGPIYMESIDIATVCEACDRVLGRESTRAA